MPTHEITPVQTIERNGPQKPIITLELAAAALKKVVEIDNPNIILSSD